MSGRRVRGSGGQSARRAARTNFVIDTAKTGVIKILTALYNIYRLFLTNKMLKQS